MRSGPLSLRRGPGRVIQSAVLLVLATLLAGFAGGCGDAAKINSRNFAQSVNQAPARAPQTLGPEFADGSVRFIKDQDTGPAEAKHDVRAIGVLAGQATEKGATSPPPPAI